MRQSIIRNRVERDHARSRVEALMKDTQGSPTLNGKVLCSVSKERRFEKRKHQPRSQDFLA